MLICDILFFYCCYHMQIDYPYMCYACICNTSLHYRLVTPPPSPPPLLQPSSSTKPTVQSRLCAIAISGTNRLLFSFDFISRNISNTFFLRHIPKPHTPHKHNPLFAITTVTSCLYSIYYI